MRQPEEMLELSAPLSRQIAGRSCRRDPETGETCAWNHGFWQYIRLMGLMAGAEMHSRFLCEAVRECTSSLESPRVLITGAADYGILAQILAGLGTKRNSARIVVVDLCDTPLLLNRWYADRVGVQIETRRADILEFAGPFEFDAVVSHAFLGMFCETRRPDLVAKWHELVRPGGTVAAVNRLRPAAAPGRTGFTPQQAEAFMANTRRVAGSLFAESRAEIECIERDALNFVRKHFVYAMRSEVEARRLFENAGLMPERLYSAPIDDPGVVAGRTAAAPHRDPYVHVMARRR